MSTANSNPPRVLILAYACDPYRGSEPGLGWNWVVEIAKHFDTWVLSKQGHEVSIHDYLERHGKVPGLHFHFVPLTFLEGFMKRLPGLYWLVYNRWHRRACRYARRLHQKIHFDLVHQLNFCTFREPGYLWKLGVPFVWGPLGGTETYPWRFYRHAGTKGAFLEFARTLTNKLQLYCSRRVRQAMGKAAIVLSINSEGSHYFRRLFQKIPVPMCDVGVKSINLRKSDSYNRQRPLRILWNGVFEARKALPLLIKALGNVPSTLEYELRILGDGPQKPRWQNLAGRTGVARYCTWLGWVSHAEALAQFNWADIFVFSSLRDSSGSVVLEAFSHGVPTICLDHQGPRDLVTEECGLKIPVTSESEVITKLGDAIAELAREWPRLARLSQGAGERAQEYLWSRKGEYLATLYHQVLAGQSSP